MSKSMPFFLAILLTSISQISIQAKDSPPQKQQKNLSTFEAFTGKITGNHVRMRAKPDLDSVIIQEFYKEDLVAVKGEENGFYSIEPPKATKGYIFRTYILDNVVEASKVNIRLEPSLDAPIVGSLLSGEHVDGNISKTNSKWLEIDLPKTTRFFVAKEYVQSVGKVELFEILQKRKSEVKQLLSNACAFSQSEMRKPFEQIQFGHIENHFQNIIQNYADFPDHVVKAKESLQLLQETYLHNKVAFLESRNSETSENYKKQLAYLENKLSQNLGNTPFQNAEEEPFMQSSCNIEAIKRWEPIEEKLYQQWLIHHPGQTKKEFYQAELTEAVTLKGVLEPYHSAVKNRPGDYLLKVNQAPVAFVYSTSVNLGEKLGENITIIALKRPNNHFAYPAFFVISVQ